MRPDYRPRKFRPSPAIPRYLSAFAIISNPDVGFVYMAQGRNRPRHGAEANAREHWRTARVQVLGVLGSVFRISTAGLGLGYSLAVALGGGVNELLTIFGLQLNREQSVFAGTVVFGAAVLWDNALLRRKLASHADSPNLLWQGVTFTPYPNQNRKPKLQGQRRIPTNSCVQERRSYDGAPGSSQRGPGNVFVPR
jgi:hypothetical protein